WKPARTEHRKRQARGGINTQPMGGFVMGGAITRLLAGLMRVTVCHVARPIHADRWFSNLLLLFLPFFRNMSIVSFFFLSCFFSNGGVSPSDIRPSWPACPRVKIIPTHLSRLHRNGWWWTNGGCNWMAPWVGSEVRSGSQLPELGALTIQPGVHFEISVIPRPDWSLHNYPPATKEKKKRKRKRTYPLTALRLSLFFLGLVSFPDSIL
ncbi:hypothetical protein MAPG_03270, partial [Magnaporthiopsis poae ATCC 64411]|uniref:Uncharacterized protein n=1 Tax=Magnaporthiopsis poae (strain ATCC 64411 / 73-15) TaxID=644358 RepID=A0A0C4DTK1_MAGP6